MTEQANIDYEQLARGLISEIASGHTIEDLIKKAEEPQFEDTTNVCDWRSYCVDYYRIKNQDKFYLRQQNAAWHRKPLFYRIILIAMAIKSANEEEWD